MFPEILSKKQLELLKEISKVKSINESFYLAGGTALALQIGHRRSYDFDFFSYSKFDSLKFQSIILKDFSGKIFSKSDDTINGMIGKIRISFFIYPYKLIRNSKQFSSIELASLEDLVCMKCSAISDRAEKRDYFDIYELFKIFQPMEVRNLLLEKYRVNGNNLYHLMKCLFNFDFVENTPEPESLNGTTWKIVKNYLIKNQQKILKAFI